MIGIIAGTVAGVFLGIISGLFPGVHSNTLAASLLGMQAFLLPVIGVEALVATMFAALITHTFLDSIPSTFLGIPDPDTALSVLPSHMLCLEGKGQEAVRIAALGSTCAVILSIPLSILLFFILPPLQPYIDWWMGIVLIAVVGYLVIECESPGWALMIFGISGLLGIFTFRYAFLGWHTLGESGVLMPLLTGMFGISVLLFSSRGPVPEQRFSGIGMTRGEIGRGTVIGTIAGTIVGWLPGALQCDCKCGTLLENGLQAGQEGLYFFHECRKHGKCNYRACSPVCNRQGAQWCNGCHFIGWYTINGISPGIGCTCRLPGISDNYLVVRLCRPPERDRWKNAELRCNYPDHPHQFPDFRSFGLFILALACIVGLIPRMVNISRVFCMGAIMIPVILYSFGIGGF